MTAKLWDGRFSEKTDRTVEAFSASIDVDRRLHVYDIQGSVAHCRTLARAGVISAEEAEAIIEGLGAVEREIAHGQFEYDDSLEDIHMHIEARLVQQIGKTAQKLHTARSRNDQVALDVRMYLRAESLGIIERLAVLRRILVDLAGGHTDTLLPGYTHLQRAQPVLLAHHLMAYYEMFSRDAERFRDGLKRINVLPLGSAALAGTTFPIDRQYTAELLDFPQVSANSIDSVADRDFVIEFLSAASVCMVHLSRMSEEFVLWSSAEFNFIELPDAFATGSSIMPQKKNPDVPELVRGKTGRVFGDLMSMLTIMKSLPLSYNRDMQEDKPPLFDGVDTLKSCIEVYIRMLPHLKINRDAMERATASGFLNATDMADYLAEKGVPFREAHNCVGQAVSYALGRGKELHDLTLDELRAFSAVIAEDIFDAIAMRRVIERRISYGGTATENVKNAVARATADLESEGA